MATWWKWDQWKDVPVPVDVVKETEHTLLVDDPFWGRSRKVNKRGNGEAYYPTEAEAVGEIVRVARVRTEGARAELERCEKKEAALRERYPDAPEWND